MKADGQVVVASDAARVTCTQHDDEALTPAAAGEEQATDHSKFLWPAFMPATITGSTSISPSLPETCRHLLGTAFCVASRLSAHIIDWLKAIDGAENTLY